MNPDMVITMVVAGVALVLFLTERFSVDLVAVGMMVSLIVTGVISPSEGVRGFANPATITIASLFVMSDALIRTGAIQRARPYFEMLLRAGYPRAIAGLNVVVGGISAFINNTPVVATLIPVVSTTAGKFGVPPSRYLLPLSFGAIFGGACTLIGTSTNLLVSGIATEAGFAGFSMFTLTPIGLVFGVAGTAYLIFFGRRLIPERAPAAEFSETGRIKKFQTEMRISKLPEDQPPTLDFHFPKDDPINVLQVKRGDQVITTPPGGFEFQAGDVVHVEGDVEKIQDLLQSEFVQISGRGEDGRFPNEQMRLVEIVLLPNSSLVGSSLGKARFLDRFSAEVLALRSRGEEHFSDLNHLKLHSGDILLLQTDEHGLRRLRQAERDEQAPFISLRETELKAVERKNLAIVLVTLAAIVLLATLQVLPVMVAAVGGVAVLGFTRTITMSQAYRAIDWKVIVLIAGALSLGEAIVASGIADHVGSLLVDRIGPLLGPVAVISALYLVTSIFTELMSNNAAVAILTPIALSAAGAMDVEPTPLLLAVAFAGSASFMTPVGYQTNTMVYSAGNYRFRDFTRVGLPLNLMLWILATILIPLFHPL